jgi:hypothetical protein
LINFPVVIRGMFDEDELISITSIANKKLRTTESKDMKDIPWEELYHDFRGAHIDKYFGKIHITLPDHDFEIFKPSTLAKILEHVYKFDDEATLKSFSIVKYSNEYGVPQLTPHVDHPTDVAFLLDIQIDGNVDWPIVVNNSPVVLKNGDAVAIDVENQVHWRTAQQFNDGDFVYMLFLFFNSKKKKDLVKEGKYEDTEKAYAKKYVEARATFDETEYDWKEIRGK